MSLPTSDSKTNELRDPVLRSCVSLALVLHLLCLGFVYSANVRPSRLQQRLAGIFAPYTQLLHLDPGGVRLQFTDGSQESDDHVVVVTPKLSDGTLDAAQAVRFPGDEQTFRADRSRIAQLTNDMAAYAQRDDLIALFARSLGAAVMREKQFDHVVVRVVHPATQPLYDDDDSQEPSTEFDVYEAEVWTDEDGVTQVQKRASGLGAAPTTVGGGS